MEPTEFLRALESALQQHKQCVVRALTQSQSQAREESKDPVFTSVMITHVYPETARLLGLHVQIEVAGPSGRPIGCCFFPPSLCGSGNSGGCVIALEHENNPGSGCGNEAAKLSSIRDALRVLVFYPRAAHDVRDLLVQWFGVQPDGNCLAIYRVLSSAYVSEAPFYRCILGGAEGWSDTDGIHL